MKQGGALFFPQEQSPSHTFLHTDEDTKFSIVTVPIWSYHIILVSTAVLTSIFDPCLDTQIDPNLDLQEWPTVMNSRLTHWFDLKANPYFDLLNDTYPHV